MNTTSQLFIVRHAEKASAEHDAPLTTKGLKRADALAQTLRSIPLLHIYATPYRRTQQTVQPTATQKAMAIELYAAPGGPALCWQWQKNPQGSVLIAAHSNTIGELMAALSLTLPFELDESRYGDLFIVDIVSGHTTLTLERFDPK